MVETIIVLVFLLFAFLAVVQFADNLRAKLLCEYAAGRCARAATIGLNDYMVLKTARLATMAAAGECFTDDESGHPPSTYGLISRFGSYLECVNEAEAEAELDFDLWRNGRTTALCTRSGATITATVTQQRPQFFDIPSWLRGTPPDDEEGFGNSIRIVGSSTIEAHYPDWMQ